MRKAFLYIIFIGLLFTNAMNARSIEMAHDAAQKNAPQKAQAETSTSNISEQTIAFQKNDFINEVVNYDEYDFDEHETSLRSKPYFVSVVPSNNNSFKVDLISNTSCSKIYYHANFSRLPRFNYISLRVLRL